ncbi:hypothetical protein AB833_11170 [Chromatiales bacterium (ex Bugula neritina AB1)]|nr:hypothetical protein AB833_11170 [Chromatiales bacterium (ex Bugula neritina AB1)]
MRCLLQIFAKYPEPGKVKTRLIPTLGAQRASELQMALLKDLLMRVHGVVDCELWGDAAADLPHYRCLIRDYSLGFRRQPDGDLGQRMEWAVASGLRRQRIPILVGSDCPLMSAEVIVSMMQVLGQEGVDAAMVPALDGGYVAMGLKIKHHSLFRGIEWGCDSVAGQTLLNMRRSGLVCEVLEPLFDIDTASDLHLLDDLRGAHHQHVIQWKNA